LQAFHVGIVVVSLPRCLAQQEAELAHSFCWVTGLAGPLGKRPADAKQKNRSGSPECFDVG
jgi:hypothetical protein